VTRQTTLSLRYVLSDCENLSIRISEVLQSTSEERRPEAGFMAVASHVLGVIRAGARGQVVRRWQALRSRRKEDSCKLGRDLAAAN